MSRPGELRSQIDQFAPDWVLVSSEDVSHILLREAGAAAPGRIVYLAHTPQFFPFGPASWNQDAQATRIVREARAVVAIAEFTAGYIREHTGREAVVVHPPIYGEAAPISEGSAVLMVNPCAVKGISIFLELARRFPDYPFAALKGWGTTRADLEALAALPNVTVLDTVRSIDEVLSNAKLLLMPSLWLEGFGLIAMEAMLRGLPVISSDAGGLVEAKRGTGFVIPVRPIERYSNTFDETGMPRPEIPPQDIEPWVQALQQLLGSQEIYEAESERSRTAARAFVSQLDAGQLEKVLLSLETPRLKILLAHNSLYYPSHGGGDRSNRLLMEAIAARGHHVRVVARIEAFGDDAHRRHLDALRERGIEARETDSGVELRLNGVDVRTLTRDARWRRFFAAQLEEFNPDIIITSTDDPAQLLFQLAVDAPRAKVVHLVRATIAVPFGPDSAAASPEKTEQLRRADLVVGVSEYVADYVRRWGGIDAIHVPISLMDSGEAQELGSFENAYVTMVNPCAVKGISIFLAVAEQLPDVRFAAVPTWGTNAEDHVALSRHANVTVLPPVDNIDDLMRQTRVLLVPSVWAEARSRIVVEAMARGVPVIASDIGGIPEAKLGVPYLIPVNPIERYQHSVDENMVPVAEVPPQNVAPWVAALRRLLSDREHYSDIAGKSRRAALEYIGRLTALPFEQCLESVVRKPKRAVQVKAAAHQLSPERQKLLALRLRQKADARAPCSSPWFPGIEAVAANSLRLFCLPPAGGGTLMYAGWKDALDRRTAVVPVRLPGRESRIAEPPIDDIRALVQPLCTAIAPHTHMPFALFGHSMGAGIAFELAHALRRSGYPLPRALFVSAARAPQFRLHHEPPPEPTDEELLEQLRRLDGLPAGVLDNPNLLRLIMPVLRADTRLYRNYIYTPEDALPVPIFAYGGASDPNVRPEHLEAWRTQTTAGFTHREFPGGHFYLQSSRDAFLEALKADLPD
jgi:surfactin synthase thioesterase subunit/glycosyltransferase involved in cell wall biosynthesis